MGKTRDLLKKIRAINGTFHAKMGTIKGRNGMDLTEAEDIKKRWQEYTEELYKKDLHDPDDYNGVIIHLEPDRRQWHPTPVLLPGKSHGWRSLVGCSPWGREESDMTERLHFHFLLSRIGEGNGNPLQCSCLENPRDGGAWWAAIYGVAQSRTRLK